MKGSAPDSELHSLFCDLAAAETFFCLLFGLAVPMVQFTISDFELHSLFEKLISKIFFFLIAMIT